MRLESAVGQVVLKWSSNEQLPYLIKYILPIIRSIAFSMCETSSVALVSTYII